jgi:hypothetical protein
LDIKGDVMAAKESSLSQGDINQVFKEKYRQLSRIRNPLISSCS